MTLHLLRCVTEVQGIAVYTVRDTRRLLKSGTEAAAHHWSSRYLPRHFIERARHIYNYKSRSHATKKKKERLSKIGVVEEQGQVDLVHTGRTRRRAKGPKTIKAYPSRATVTINTPKYIRTNYKPGRPHLADEMTRIIPNEMTSIDKASEDAMEKTMKTLKPKKTTKT